MSLCWFSDGLLHALPVSVGRFVTGSCCCWSRWGSTARGVLGGGVHGVTVSPCCDTTVSLEVRGLGRSCRVGPLPAGVRGLRAPVVWRGSGDALWPDCYRIVMRGLSFFPLPTFVTFACGTGGILVCKDPLAGVYRCWQEGLWG